MVCIDVKASWFGDQRTWTARGSKKSRYAPEELAKLMEAKGAGEVIIQSIDRDGMMTGYDLDLVRSISASVTVPVIALGGAGTLEHMRQAFFDARASAVAAGSLFVFHGPRRGVLINYPERAKRSFS
jgi:cyclase